MRFRTLLLLAAMPIGCGGAAGDDGPIPTKSDAHHDGADTFEPLDDTAVDDTGSTLDDTATSSDTGARDAASDSSLVCTLDTYDVDGDPANGCEVVEVDDDHDFSAPYSFGSVSECDTGAGGGYGWVTHDDTYASDTRLHDPGGVDEHLGRPDYIEADHSSSTFCENDPTWQLTMTGGTGKYRVTLYRHGSLSEIDTKCSPQDVGGGESTIEFKCTGQDDGEKAIFKIEKVSGPPEAVSYTFKYHN